MSSIEEQRIRQLENKVALLTENPDYRALFEKYCLLAAQLTITEVILEEKRLLEPIAHAALDLVEGYNRWVPGDTEAKFAAMVLAAEKWGESTGYILCSRVQVKAVKRHRTYKEIIANQYTRETIELEEI